MSDINFEHLFYEFIDNVCYINDIHFSKVFFISKSYEKVWGQKCESLIANPREWLNLIPEEDLPTVYKAMEDLKDKKSYETHHRIIRRDGEERWIKAQGKVIDIEVDGSPLVIGIATDITHEKQLIEEKEIFLREFNHRMKNNFQMMSSLMSIQASSTDNLEVKKALNSMNRKIFSMGLVHEMLNDKELKSCVDICKYLARMVEFHNQHDLDNTDCSEIVFECCNENIPVDTKVATYIGLIFNELITNSNKHSIEKSKKIKSFCKISQMDEQLEFFFMDEGPFYVRDYSAAHNHGKGLVLVKGLISNLKGSCEYICISDSEDSSPKEFVNFLQQNGAETEGKRYFYLSIPLGREAD